MCVWQIHVLKIFGGLPETCHMCRLLDVESVKLLCAVHKVDVPPILDQLLNDFSSQERKGRFCVSVHAFVLVVVVICSMSCYCLYHLIYQRELSTVNPEYFIHSA